MTLTYTDDLEWRSGDIALLSTDGVRFRVPLKLHATLRQAPPESLLRAPANASTLRAFLSLASSKTYTLSAWEDALPLLRLLQAWNAPNLREIVFASVHASGFSLGAFVLAAVGDSPSLARGVIKAGADQHWGWTEGGTPNRPILDPATWPAYMHSLCPGPWAYALARAWQLTRDAESKDEAELLASAFERVLARARGPSSKVVGGDDPAWTDGEWSLLSADGVRFRVPAYLLLSLSPVFRDMASMGSGPPDLEFTDVEIESAAVLRLLLHFVSAGNLAQTPSTAPHAVEYALEDVLLLVLFLRKWQAGPTLNHALLLVERASGRGECCVLRAFMVAAAVKDAPLLAALVAKHDAFFPASETDGVVGRTVWDPAGWPLAMWNLCPPRYAVAAARAWGETCGSSARARDFPRAFHKWLEV
ncbi:hypothetical protein CspeluHIS016_0504050 [Cutaneotrichosporon spelunceum]|uniref:BTB domain-containing protein n=1 Tax=Cutaneotrichosporon spelunceum TaxID=1672016 RepID=A0AAD3YDR3_9TREE|nr:hypothetical protein CspeluHIS016_0504050 [Cutaneotrichosporon spelunceum]